MLKEERACSLSPERTATVLASLTYRLTWLAGYAVSVLTYRAPVMQREEPISLLSCTLLTHPVAIFPPARDTTLIVCP
jgi:predicted cobalt transporter CbtA